MDIVDYISDEHVERVEKWINDYKQNLKQYLKDISTNLEAIDTNIHCRDLNYILDTIIERIFKLKRIKRIRLQHDIEKFTIDLLNGEFEKLNCNRKIYESNNTNMHIKKHMYDLCEDIKYIIEKKMERKGLIRYCNLVFPRVLKRWKELRDVYYSNQQHEVFHSDSNCTIDYIMKNFSDKKCNYVPEPRKGKAKTVSTLREQPAEDQSPALRAEARPVLDTKEGLRPDPEAAPDQEDELDPNGMEESDFLMDMPLKLTSGEAEPKLDTTYAAASLCGVSLIGAMIYKVK
ncbi:hypothetical protein PVMG_05888 [Plasmodium vivax Mauritania I]|uniref:Uncharacterized protein n=1 Tax=Plasmodium vivax Mauritania I TaxID=1035515 RepID=A0A0J9THX1_PLAVI|nr:hypothetical protein PVMG_05888 [Plasmodium vivax Mauritania I]